MQLEGEPTDHFIVSPDEALLRLDKLLSLRFPDYSRTYFQFLIERGCVLVNGKACKKKELPKVGDEIEVCFLLTPEISLEPQEIPLEILYEDDHLIAVNKPAGMVVHPAPGHPKDTFVNALLFHCRQLEGTGLRPGIVHRLDKDTSGVLLAAKTAGCHAKLIALFSERKIQKYYMAVCVGSPKEGLIDAAIGRHPLHRKEMTVRLEGEGREAKSICRLLGTGPFLSLVEMQILTGRTHQIRVHLKHVGTPILGDPVYGSPSANKKFKIARQLLHAERIEFVHPITQEALRISAPPPQDLIPYITELK